MAEKRIWKDKCSKLEHEIQNLNETSHEDLLDRSEEQTPNLQPNEAENYQLLNNPIVQYASSAGV